MDCNEEWRRMKNGGRRVDGNARGGRGRVGVAFRFRSRRMRRFAFGVCCNWKPRPPRTGEGRPSRRKGGQFLTQNKITPTRIQSASQRFHSISTWIRHGLVVSDLKANQTDEGQPSEKEPAQSSDHYDKK
jgi:hypothetical protein